MADPETPKVPEPPAPAETPATPEPKAESTAEKFLRQRDEQLARGGGIFETAAKGFLSGFGGGGGGPAGPVPYGTPSQDVTLKGTGDVTTDITRPQPKEELTRLPRIERVPDLKLSFTKITTGLGGEVDRVLQKSQQEIVSAISQTYNVLKDRVFTIQKSLTILDKNVKIVDTRQRKFQGDTQALLESMKAAIERQKVQQQSIDQKFMKIDSPEKKRAGAAEAGLGGIGDILKDVAKWWAAGKVGLATVGAVAAAGPLAGAAARAAGMRTAAATAATIAQAVAKAVPSAVALYLAYKFKVNPVTGALEYFQSPGDYTKKKREQAKENWPDWMFPEYWTGGDPNIMNKARERVNQQKPKWTGKKPTGLGEDIWNMFGGSAKAAERPTGEKPAPTTKTTPDKVSVEKTQVDITAKESILLKGTREVNIKAPKITIEASEIVFRGKVTGLPSQAGPAAATGGGYGPGGLGGTGRAAEQVAWRGYGYDWPQAAGPRGALSLPQMSGGTWAAFGDMIRGAPPPGGPRGALSLPQMSGGTRAALGQMVGGGGGGMGFPPTTGRPSGGVAGAPRVAGVPAMAAYGISPRGGRQTAAATMASTPTASRMPRMAATTARGGGAAPSTFTPTAPGEIAEYLKKQLSEGDAYTRSQTGIEAVRQKIQGMPPPVMFGKGAPGIPETPGLFGMIGNVAGALTGAGAAAGAMLGGLFGGGAAGGGGVPGFRGAGRGGGGGGGGGGEVAAPPPELDPNQQKALDDLLKSGSVDINDPKYDWLKKLPADQLSGLGITRTDKALVYVPPTLSTEDAKKRILEESGKVAGAQGNKKVSGETLDNIVSHMMAGDPKLGIKGMTKAEATVMAANFYQEGGFSMKAIGDKSIPGGSRGLAQWNRNRLWKSQGGEKSLEGWAEKNGLDMNDHRTQVLFSMWEQQQGGYQTFWKNYQAAIARGDTTGAYNLVRDKYEVGIHDTAAFKEGMRLLGSQEAKPTRAPGDVTDAEVAAYQKQYQENYGTTVSREVAKLAVATGVTTAAAGEPVSRKFPDAKGQTVNINKEVYSGKKPFIEGTAFSVPVIAQSSEGGAFDESLEKLTPAAVERLKKQAIAAKAAGLDHILLHGAQSKTGHVSHGAGTETDIVGMNADGKPWSRDQRATTALGAISAGAERFGFYGGQGLHVGATGAGKAAWGPGGKTGGVPVSEFTPGLEREIAAWARGTGPMPRSEKLEQHIAAMEKAQKETEVAAAPGAPKGVQVAGGGETFAPGTPTPEVTPTTPKVAASTATAAVPPRDSIAIQKGEPGYDVKPVTPPLPGGTPRLDAAPKPPPVPEMPGAKKPAAEPTHISPRTGKVTAGAGDATPAAAQPKVPVLTPEQRKDLTPGTVGEGPLKQTPTKPPPKPGQKKESVVKKKDPGDRTSELTKPKETAVKTKENKKAPSEDRPSSGGDRGSSGGGGGSNPDHCHFCDP